MVWPLRADPAGRFTPLPAPGPAATRLGSRRSRHRLPSPTSPGHGLDLLLRARLHSLTSSRIMSPVGDTHGHGQRSRQISVVTYPCSRPAVTSPRYLTSPGHGPPVSPFTSPGSRSLFPQPVYPLGSCSQCSDFGSAAHGSLHGAWLEDRSRSGVAYRHAAALYSKRRAGSITRAAGWSCGEE